MTMSSESNLVARPDTIWVCQFRIVLLGDSTVGKSALLRQFTDGQFFEVSDPTVGVDFYSRLIEIAPATRIRLQLWDTAGQERFRSITRSYYRNSVGALLVYDITNRESFEHICHWAEEAKLHAAPRQLSFALIGQKVDLQDQRMIPTEEGNAFAQQHNMPFVEVSAKQGIRVQEAFAAITEQLYRLVKQGELRAEDGWEGVKSGLVPNNTETCARNSSCCKHS